MSNPSCYLPDGSELPSYAPCYETDDDSPVPCCELSTSACTDTGYCAGNSGLFYRGGCTDRNWNTTNCPQPCPSDQDSQYSNLFVCESQNSSHAWAWCCQGMGTPIYEGCCSSGLFYSAIGKPTIAARVVTRTLSGDGTFTATTTTTTTATAALQSGEPDASCPSNSAADSSAMTRVVGFAVGITLGVLLLIACAACAFLAYKLNKMRKQTSKTRYQPSYKSELTVQQSQVLRNGGGSDHAHTGFGPKPEMEATHRPRPFEMSANT